MPSSLTPVRVTVIRLDFQKKKKEKKKSSWFLRLLTLQLEFKSEIFLQSPNLKHFHPVLALINQIVSFKFWRKQEATAKKLPLKSAEEGKEKAATEVHFWSALSQMDT